MKLSAKELKKKKAEMKKKQGKNIDINTALNRAMDVSINRENKEQKQEAETCFSYGLFRG